MNRYILLRRLHILVPDFLREIERVRCPAGTDEEPGGARNQSISQPAPRDTHPFWVATCISAGLSVDLIVGHGFLKE